LEGFLDFLSIHGPLVRESLATSPRRFVEVGCGGANVAIFMGLLGLESAGLDIEEGVIVEARRHADALNAKVDLRVADGFATGEETDAFDVAASQGVLEHFSDDQIEAFLAESIRIAKRTVASMPNANYPEHDFGNERLMPLEFWRERGVGALRRSGAKGRVTAFDYRRRFDLRHPVNSLMNLALRRCYFTLLVIDRE
jgi:SAM-dependent methyltransferase